MSTKHFAVVGDPIEQSASPRMHNAAYAALGLDCTYEAIRASVDDLPTVLARLKTGELEGLNVTIPHKQRVLSYADVVDAGARAAGAANTLVRSTDGRIIAHNTDVPALAAELASLPAPGFAWKGAHVLVLGTGATSRSAILALGRHLGVAHVTVRGRAFARDDARKAFHAEVTELLRRAEAGARVSLEPWGPVVATDREVSAIVQATSLGMAGGDAGELAASGVAWSVVQPGAVALDVVYAATMTPFLEAAKARGLRFADGRGMLAWQGALAFELWLGRPAPVDVMRAALAT